MKSLLERILPPTIKQMLVDILSLIKTPFYYWKDGWWYVKHSGMLRHNNSQMKMIARITMAYHGIEKGLTMPEMRSGFGAEAMATLTTLCDEYLRRRYDTTHCQFLHALGVIKEYKKTHDEKGFQIDVRLSERIDNLLRKINRIPEVRQTEIGAEEYFRYADASFDKFSPSRRSVRYFSEKEVEIDIIQKAVSIAQNAPSSCNRQSPRVYVIQHKDTIKKVLTLQQGNRGFGHLANKLLIVTAELGVYNSIKERHSAWVDGGMFAMNLLHALHFYRIGSCTLNCYFSPREEALVRDICDIPQSEILVVIIAVGTVPQHFRVACSKRMDIDDILRIR